MAGGRERDGSPDSADARAEGLASVRQRRVCAVPATTVHNWEDELLGTLRFAHATRDGAPSPDVGQILLENRHLKLERAIVILVIDEQHADELLADIDLSGVVLFRPRNNADLRFAEYALEIGVELPDFLNVHGGLQSDSLISGRFLGRDGADYQP